MSRHQPEKDVKELEAALVALVPAAPAIDRDRLMFRAGQASARSQPRLWQVSTAALALVSAGLVTTLVLRPAPEPIVKLMRVPQIVDPSPEANEAPTPVEFTSAPSYEPEVPRQAAYLRMARDVLRWGLDGLGQAPAAPPARAQPMTLQHLRELPPPAPSGNIFARWLYSFSGE